MLTSTKKLTVLGWLLVLVIGATPTAYGQIVYGQPASGQLGLTYYHWQADSEDGEETIDQLALPLTGFLPVRENFDMSFYVANASSSFEDQTGEFTLSGLSDLRAQANHSFAQDRVLVSASINLPTGKREFDGEQQRVLLELTRNYLEFPVRRYGEGFGFSLLVGGALELREGLRAGGGVTYQYVGSYTPYEDFVGIDTILNDTSVISFEGYDPGDVISINGGFDLERGPMIWSLDMIFAHYTPDKMEDVKTFRQSRQFDWRLRADYATETSQFSGMLRYIWRGENRLYSPLGEWDATRKLFGNEFQAAADFTYPFSTDWYVIPSADFRLIAGSEVTDGIELEGSNIFGVGAAIGRDFSPRVSGQVGFRLFTGSADGGAIDVSGYRINLGLSATM